MPVTAPTTPTPGPWTVDAITERWRQDLAIEGEFWVAGGPVDEVIATISRTRDGSALADAHLMAAAPDLLAALREMVTMYDGTDAILISEGVKAKLGRARAAIAKAEGLFS